MLIVILVLTSYDTRKNNVGFYEEKKHGIVHKSLLLLSILSS